MYKRRSRRKCKLTAVSWIINVSASVVSFQCGSEFKFSSTVQNHSFNGRGDNPRAFWNSMFRRMFLLFYHTRGGQSRPRSSALTFWTLNYSIFKQGKGRKIYKLTRTWFATRSSYNYSMWKRKDVQTFKVCLQQRLSKVTWNYTWNLTLRRWISLRWNSIRFVLADEETIFWFEH